jgi:glycosyltransferase involved in cell wall biosynthesis
VAGPGGARGSTRLTLMQVLYSFGQGGSETLARDLALRLDRSRVRSFVCALDVGGPIAGDLEREGIPVRVTGRRPGLDWRLLVTLYRLFRQQRVDIVQTHHLTQLLYSAAGARLAGAALVHVEHEYYSLRHPKAKRRLRLLARLCHRVVAVGEEVRAFLLNHVGIPAGKAVVIPNGVDLVRYTPEPRTSRQTLGLRPAGPLIGHVARLEPDKDQETLLRAFRIVLDSCAEATLAVVGDGALRDRLSNRARSLGVADRVDFLGLRRDVAEILPHLDAFVLSSRNEGLPLAILEAMACGRPVVATAVGAVPELIEHGISGFVVLPGDPSGLAAALATVLQDRQRAEGMGRAARQVVAARFDLDSTVAQYQRLYDSLRSRAGRPDGARPSRPG